MCWRGRMAERYRVRTARCEVALSSFQSLPADTLWSSRFSSALHFHVRLDTCHILLAVCHTMAWYMSCLCCAGKSLHGINIKRKISSFIQGFFDSGVASCRALDLNLCQAGLFPLPVLLQGPCWTPSLSMPKLAVRMGQHTWAHCGVGGSETMAFLATTNLTTMCLAFPILMPELSRAKPSPPAQPALWTPEPHAQGRGKSRAQQVFGAADPSLSHHSLSCKFLWVCPWLQINAGWGPLSRPSPFRCSCGFYWHKEEP